jgi:hypothetical protein
MLTVIVTAFASALLFNLFVIVFGTKDVQALKTKMAAGGSYLKEINRALIEGLGDQAATGLKLVLTVLAILFLIWHLVTAILALLAVALGTWTAKRLYKITAVSEVLNRLATYVNRLRQ